MPTIYSFSASSVRGRSFIATLASMTMTRPLGVLIIMSGSNSIRFPHYPTWQVAERPPDNAVILVASRATLVQRFSRAARESWQTVSGKQCWQTVFWQQTVSGQTVSDRCGTGGIWTNWTVVGPVLSKPILLILPRFFPPRVFRFFRTPNFPFPD